MSVGLYQSGVNLLKILKLHFPKEQRGKKKEICLSCVDIPSFNMH